MHPQGLRDLRVPPELPELRGTQVSLLAYLSSSCAPLHSTFATHTPKYCGIWWGLHSGDVNLDVYHHSLLLLVQAQLSTQIWL